MKSIDRKQRTWMPTRLLLAAMTVGAVGMSLQFAQAQQGRPEMQGQRESQGSEGQELKVGTYERQTAFMAYHGTVAFQEEMQQMQQQAGNDPQQMAQVQQQAVQKQQQLIQQFQRDIEEAMPEVAQETGVKLIVAEISYRDPSVQVQDITPAVTEKLNAGQGEEGRMDQPAGRYEQQPAQRQGQQGQGRQGQGQQGQGQMPQGQDQPQRQSPEGVPQR